MEAVETRQANAICGVCTVHLDTIGNGHVSALKFSSKKENSANPNEKPVTVTLKSKLAGIKAGSTECIEGGS
jgi:hypothetical protein